MISAIVFSKNRACQLHLFLESVRKNANNVFDLTILYSHTDDSYKEAYQRVVGLFPEFNFVCETNFRDDTINLCENVSNDTLAFFVDDDIIYRELSLEDSFVDIFNSNVCSLSLRLGANTVIQDCYTGSGAIMPNIEHIVNDKFYCWNWLKMAHIHTNFGYPFSVDGNVYIASEITQLIKAHDFDTPNSLEGGMPKGWLKEAPLMACLETSVLVNTPINLVGSSQNRAGEHYGISIEEMNDKYIDGWFIDYDSIDFSNIKGCHQELQMGFKCDLHLE